MDSVAEEVADLKGECDEFNQTLRRCSSPAPLLTAWVTSHCPLRDNNVTHMIIWPL